MRLLRRHRLLPLTLRRRDRRSQTLARSVAPRAARGTTLRCEPSNRPTRSRLPQPLRLRRRQRWRVAGGPAHDTPAETDKDLEKIAPASGLIALVRAAASKRARPSSASSAYSSSGGSDSRMSGRSGPWNPFPPAQRGAGPEHGRTGRSVTRVIPQEFFGIT